MADEDVIMEAPVKNVYRGAPDGMTIGDAVNDQIRRDFWRTQCFYALLRGEAKRKRMLRKMKEAQDKYGISSDPTKPTEFVAVDTFPLIHNIVEEIEADQEAAIEADKAVRLRRHIGNVAIS